MALVKCAECGHEISDKATTCPHCSAPIAAAPMGTAVCNIEQTSEALKARLNDYNVNSLIQKIFDQDFYNMAYMSNSFTVEEIFIEDEYYCTRVIFSKKHIDNEYVTEETIGKIRIKKYVRLKWSYIKFVEKNVYNFQSLIDLFAERISDNHAMRIIDPAAHGDWPLWYLARKIDNGARLVLLYDKRFPEPSRPSEKRGANVFSETLADSLNALENEIGISVNELPFLKNSMFFIFPYENAVIERWKLFEEEENWEGLECVVKFDRYLHPFPEYMLECKLFNRQKELFYQEEFKINHDHQLVFKVLPQKDSSQEIYKVKARLYENGRLIDDYSGHPVRKIEVKFRPMDKKQS